MSVTFAELTQAVAFPARLNAVGIAHAGKLWITTGTDNAVNFNDVWSSDDGATWIQKTAAAGFSARVDAAGASFLGKMWVIGGNDGTLLDDIWSSVDGVTWTLEVAHAAFGRRCYHAVTAFNGKLWVVGGRIAFDPSDSDYYGPYQFNDAWSSVDGVTWVEESAAVWPTHSSGEEGVFDHGLAVLGSSMYAIGGVHFNGIATRYIGWVMQTPDGVTWTRISEFNIGANIFDDICAQMSLAAADNKLWLIAGSQAAPNGPTSSAWTWEWSSSDGITWAFNGWLPGTDIASTNLSRHLVIALGADLYIYSGLQDGYLPINRVWKGTGPVVAPPELALIEPEADAIEQSLTRRFSWTDMGDVTRYQFQIATDETFADLVADISTPDPTVNLAEEVGAIGYPLDFNGHYFWRVRTFTGQAPSDWTEARAFTTESAFLPYAPIFDHAAQAQAQLLQQFLGGI